jgi:hypothetical protein
VRCLDNRWNASYRNDVPHECFADEIAIDFPSVQPVVERMRDAFLGEPSAPDVLTADLHLSPREAFDGLDVPLDVPIRTACPLCGGRGESWTERCHPCGGTGESVFHHVVRLAVPARVADGTRLRFRVISTYAATVRVEVRVAIRPAISI